LSASQLAERLGQGLDGMSFEEQAALITDIATLAGSQGVAGLQPLLAVSSGNAGITSQMMHQNLRMVVDKSDPVQIMKTLQSTMEEQLGVLERAHRMVIEGIAAVQAGNDPKEIGEMLRVWVG